MRLLARVASTVVSCGQSRNRGLTTSGYGSVLWIRHISRISFRHRE